MEPGSEPGLEPTIEPGAAPAGAPRFDKLAALGAAGEAGVWVMPRPSSRALSLCAIWGTTWGSGWGHTDLLNLAPLQETVALVESDDKITAAVGVLNNIDDAAKKIDNARGVLEAFKMAVAPTTIWHLPQFSAA